MILLEFLSQNKALVEELWSGETMLISVSAFRNVIVAQLTNQIVMVINDPFLDQVRLKIYRKYIDKTQYWIKIIFS